MNDGLKSTRNRWDDAMSRLDLEQLRALLAEYYRRQGYRVDAFETAAADSEADRAGDANIDLQLQRDDSRLLVRCMHWNDKQVPHLRVRAWEGVLADANANGAILATSGEFTASAIRTASISKTMRLVDGAELRKMLVPILNEDTACVEERAFADFDIELPLAPIAAPNTATSTPPLITAVVADAERDSDAWFAPESESNRTDDLANATTEAHPLESTQLESNQPELNQFGPNQLEPAHLESNQREDERLEHDPSALPTSAPKKRFAWERGRRPASTLSFAVASVLLTLIVLTIVFRHRLDPYLGDPPRPVVKAPKNESPLAGTDYKSDVFAPVVPPQQADATTPKQTPKSQRPTSGIGEPPKAEEAIKVIAPSTPEMWPEEQRRKAAAAAAAAAAERK